MKKLFFILLIVATMVCEVIAFERDIYPSGDKEIYKSPVDPLFSMGTAEGQMLYWDAVAGVWVVTDVNLLWDDVNDVLDANSVQSTDVNADNISDGTATISGGIGTFAQIIDNGLTANLGVYTNGSKQLTSTPPSSGVLGYWSRAGTIISTATAGDDITTTGLGKFKELSITDADWPYTFKKNSDTVSEEIVLFSSVAGSDAIFGLMPSDGDGTDSVFFNIYSMGTPNDSTDFERLQFGYAADNTFYIRSQFNGAGGEALLPIKISASGSDQLVLNINGTASFGGGLNVLGDFSVGVAGAAATIAVATGNTFLSGDLIVEGKDIGITGTPSLIELTNSAVIAIMATTLRVIDIDATGDVDIGGFLEVTDDINALTNIIVTGNIEIGAPSTHTHTLNIVGEALIVGNDGTVATKDANDVITVIGGQGFSTSDLSTPGKGSDVNYTSGVGGNDDLSSVTGGDSGDYHLRIGEPGTGATPGAYGNMFLVETGGAVRIGDVTVPTTGVLEVSGITLALDAIYLTQTDGAERIDSDADGTLDLYAGTSIDLHSKLITTSGRIVNTTRVTTTYSILVTDHEVFGDTDGGAFTATLPTGVDGQTHRVINVGSSTNDLTIAVQSGEKILGVTNDTFILADAEAIILTFETTEGWF